MEKGVPTRGNNRRTDAEKRKKNGNNLRANGASNLIETLNGKED